MHIEGLLLKDRPSTFVVESSVADSDHHGIAVATGWETLVRERLTIDPKFRCFLSDDAGQCGRGKTFFPPLYNHGSWKMRQPVFEREKTI